VNENELNSSQLGAAVASRPARPSTEDESVPSRSRPHPLPERAAKAQAAPEKVTPRPRDSRQTPDPHRARAMQGVETRPLYDMTGMFGCSHGGARKL